MKCSHLTKTVKRSLVTINFHARSCGRGKCVRKAFQLRCESQIVKSENVSGEDWKENSIPRKAEVTFGMAEDEVFIKRVDFEENNNKKTSNSPTTVIKDLEKSAEPEKNPSCTTKFCDFLEKFGIKSALSHIGLLLSLGLFCLGGGWVRLADCYGHPFICTLSMSASKLKQNLAVMILSFHRNWETIKNTLRFLRNAMLFIKLRLYLWNKTRHKLC